MEKFAVIDEIKIAKEKEITDELFKEFSAGIDARLVSPGEAKRSEPIEEVPKADNRREELMQALVAAQTIGDPELIDKYEKELGNFDKTGVEIFEEAQALAAGNKFDLTTPEGRQAQIRSEFPEAKKEPVKTEPLKMEEVEKERQKKADAEMGKTEAEMKKEGRTQEIGAAKSEMEKTRRDYLEVDYKKKKAYRRLFKFFGSLGKDGRDLETDEEITRARANYENKLFDYKNILINDAKERGISNQELGEIVKIFAVEKEVDLANAQIDVKAGHQEGAVKFFKSSMDRYRKLSLTKKIAIGAAFGLGAFGTAYVGATAAGAIGAALAIRRAFLGAVTGTSTALWLENKGAKKRQKAAKKEAAEFSARLAGQGTDQKTEWSEAEKIKLALQRIDELNFSSDRALQKVKNKNLAHLAVGTLVGTFIGSGLAAELGGKAWHKGAEAYQRIKELFGTKGGGTYDYQFGPSPEAPPEKPWTPPPGFEVIRPEDITPEDVSPVDHISPPEPEASEITENVTRGGYFDNVAPEESSGAAEHIQTPEAAEIINPDNDFSRSINSIINDLDGQINNNAQELGHSYMHSPEQLSAFEEKISDLGYSREFLSQFKESILSGDQNGAAKSFQKAISLGEDWDKIKGLDFKEASAKMNWRASGKLESAFRSLKDIIGDRVRPGSGETLEAWTKRVAKLAVEASKG